MLNSPLGAYLSEIRIEVQKYSFIKMHLKMSPAKLPTIIFPEKWVKALLAFV